VARDIVAADIGGTHARFALAAIDGGTPRLGAWVTLRTSEYPDLASAWRAFAAQAGRPLPRAAGIAIATPLGGETLKLTNSAWLIHPAALAGELGLDTLTLVNDFGAVAQAVARLGADQFEPLAGPMVPLPEEGVITIVGPGTGLGVAMLLRRGGETHVIESEGGHIDFAPVDAVETQILDRLRARYGRVSVERVVSGPGLANLHEALAAIAGQAVPPRDDRALWAAALGGGDPLAAAAFDRFCLSFGSVAGDLALAQGAAAVVVAGGVGARIAERLPLSGFAQRFVAKGRFAARMAAIPVHRVTHPQPGLFGAAAAYAAAHR
jgi:glucokinase